MEIFDRILIVIIAVSSAITALSSIDMDMQLSLLNSRRAVMQKQTEQLVQP